MQSDRDDDRERHEASTRPLWSDCRLHIQRHICVLELEQQLHGALHGHCLGVGSVKEVPQSSQLHHAERQVRHRAEPESVPDLSRGRAVCGVDAHRRTALVPKALGPHRTAGSGWQHLHRNQQRVSGGIV